jgi:hypothetical protein
MQQSRMDVLPWIIVGKMRTSSRSTCEEKHWDLDWNLKIKWNGNMFGSYDNNVCLIWKSVEIIFNWPLLSKSQRRISVPCDYAIARVLNPHGYWHPGKEKWGSGWSSHWSQNYWNDPRIAQDTNNFTSVVTSRVSGKICISKMAECMILFEMLRNYTVRVLIKNFTL